MKRRIRYLLIITLLGYGYPLVAPGSVTAKSTFEEEFTREIPFKKGGSFSLKNVNGKIELSGWDEDKVYIHAVKKVCNVSRQDAQEWLDRLEISITGSGNRVEVETIYPKKKWWGKRPSMEVTYEVKLPTRADIRLKTVNGRIEAYTLEGDINLETVNGKIETKKLKGFLQAETVNGTIRMEKIEGSVDAETVNGSIKADIERHKEGEDMEFSTVNGSITLGLPSSISADLDISCINGGINLDFPVLLQGEISKRKIRGKINEGGPLIHIKTVNGSVKVKKL